MSVLQYVLVISTISGYLQLAAAEKWVKSNTQGSFAMGFMDGYINNGDYDIIVPKGSDETKRDILIKSEKVRDSVYMVFNPNTMVFSNWEGWFKLGNKVYSDSPGVLYFMRTDHKCDKKRYDKQGDEIRTIDRVLLDESECQAIKAKVDEKMNHFLKYPFKYMLPTPDIQLKTLKGFPGGEYYTGKVSGNVYVCQYSVEIPPGDTDKDKEIVISGPGVRDIITMKVNANTQIYGKWDGTFYIGDKVYSNEPRVVYVDDDKGNCVKKVFKDHETSIAIAYTKILQANDCFLIKNEVYNDMQKLISDPKLLAEDEKPKPPPQNPPPITVTSTVIYPKQDQANAPSTMSGVPSQSTHTITVGSGAPNSEKRDYSGSSGVAPTNIQGIGQANTAGNYQVQTSNTFQQQAPNPASGMNSHVHISTVTSDHPDYPSVTATSVTQSQNPQQTPSVGQPQTVLVNQGQTAQITPQVITVSQPNNAMPNQVQLVVPPGSSSPTYFLQPGNTPSPATQNDPKNALNLHSNNVNIQSDGSFLVDGKSLILQGLDPNADLITPDGNVFRVGRSVNQQQETSTSYQTVSFANQPNTLPVVTLSGNSQTQSGNIQTVLTVPPNEESSQIQHTTTLNVPNNGISGTFIQQNQQGNPSPLAVNTNFVVKSATQQPASKLYFLQPQPTVNNDNTQPKVSNSPMVLKLVQPGSSVPTVIKFQNNNMQPSPQNVNIQNSQSQNQISQQSSIVLTTATQANSMSTNEVKPVLLTVKSPGGEQGAQGNPNVHLSLGGSGSSILISSQANKQQQSSTSQLSEDTKEENKKDEKGKSVFNLMRDLNLPTPVNNLIVNIAENTNFHKKKK